MELTNSMIDAAADELAQFWPDLPKVQLKARAQLALEAAGQAYDREVPTLAKAFADHARSRGDKFVGDRCEYSEEGLKAIGRPQREGVIVGIALDGRFIQVKWDGHKSPSSFNPRFIKAVVKPPGGAA